jgi:hypothetical protein
VLPGRLLPVGFDDQQLTGTTTSPAIASGGSLDMSRDMLAQGAAWTLIRIAKFTNATELKYSSAQVKAQSSLLQNAMLWTFIGTYSNCRALRWHAELQGR